MTDMLTHAQIWAGIDALAKKHGVSVSGLAKKTGLDPTAFNKSKRGNPNGEPRWPNTSSLALVLTATNTSLSEFARMIEPVAEADNKPATPIIPEGFISWHGGECPVAEGVEGEVVFADGGMAYPAKLSLFIKLLTSKNCGFDIIAYRPIRPEGFKIEAGKWYIAESGERVGPMDRFPSTQVYYSKNLAQYSKGEWRVNGDVTLPPNCYGAILCLAADQGDAP